MIGTFAALAEPNRFRIVELLRSGPRSVNEIGDRLALSQPQVSKHLRVLREAGIVHATPRAQQRLYELRAVELKRLHDWLERFEALDELIDELKREEGADGRQRTR